jgi:hypothetical protein
MIFSSGFVPGTGEPAFITQSLARGRQTRTAIVQIKKPDDFSSGLYPGRELNPYSHYWPQDFKSCVSTNSTTRADPLLVIKSLVTGNAAEQHLVT